MKENRAGVLAAFVSLAVATAGATVFIVRLENRVDGLEESVTGLGVALAGHIEEPWGEGGEDAPRHTPGQAIGFANEGPHGVWSDALFCPDGQYVCGLRQKVEPPVGSGDDTTMNAVEFYCCPLKP